ncbi:MAG: protein-L-isoaspartate O-methyltransferase [Silicimonas sp.]|nr:protein-L-isoaspartate O-methyltransferase [Silicimonas sp.]
MADFSRRRTMMVDTQVRPSDVTKFPIIDAMLTVPRELFVPVDRREIAYMGEHVGMGGGRVILDPRTLAKMLEAANIQNDEMVLDIGSGLGYSAAVAAHIAEAVIAVEDSADRVRDAENALAEAGIDNVAVVEGVLAEGALKSAPYDVILIQGAVETVPQGLIDQLKEGGRIVAIFMTGALGAVRVGYRIDGAVSWRFAFNASAPLLPGFEAAKAFAL